MRKHEIGLVKDVLWYLKGVIELRAIMELKQSHLIALSDIIEEAQKKEEK